MNDTLYPEGLVPSLLVFGVIPSVPGVNKTLPVQTEQMAAIGISRSEMAIITAELRITQAIQAKLPLATKIHYEPGDIVLL